MTTRKTTRRNSSKGRSHVSQPNTKFTPPNTTEEFFALPEHVRRSYEGVANLATRVRAGVSRTRGMRELGLTRSQVDRYGRGAFQKLKNGRYVAKAYDHLLRVVMVVSNDGLREVATRDSRQASKAGKHSAAVNRYLQTGNDSALRRFDGKYIIDSQGKRIPLLSDVEELDVLGSAGVLSFESLYARNL